MYTRILVPLDTAVVTERVLIDATAVAMRFNATVTLVHIVSPPLAPPVPVLPGSYADPEQSAARAREEGQRALDMLARRLRDQDISVETAQLEGVPARELAAYAQRFENVLVVMAGPSTSGLGRFFSDRLAETLLSSVPCPVLLVPVRER